MMTRTLRACLLVCVGLSSTVAGAASYEDFARLPEFRGVKISPGGDYLAISSLYEGRRVIGVRRTSDMSLLNVLRVANRQDVGWYGWVNDDRLVVSPVMYLGYLESGLPTGELIGVDADGDREGFIFGLRAGQQQTGTMIKREKPDEAHPTIIDRLHEKDKEVMIVSHPWPSSGKVMPEAYRLNVYTGRKFPLGSSPIRNPFSRLWADQTGAIRLAAGEDDDGLFKVFRRADNGDWVQHTENHVSEGGLQPLGFAADGRLYALHGSAEQTRGLALIDLASGAAEEVYRHPVVDIDVPDSRVFSLEGGNVIWSRDRDRVLGVRIMPGKGEDVYFDHTDPETRLHRSLDAAFAPADARIVSQTDDGSKAIVLVSSDRNPGDYYLFDTTTMGAQFLVSRRSWIDPESMAEQEPIEIEARDGQRLHGYLTRPRKGAENAPMIVWVHGGPAARDEWGFDSTVQAFAANGFAVLQINFRGSTGYGPRFMTAAYNQWGRLTQDDITDATRWAIDQGIVDADRICIGGVSFGAYSAMMGAVREPDLYRCAIGVAGVYDLEWLHTKGDIQREYRFRRFLSEAIGTDDADLKARSPVHHASDIKAAVLLAHGGQDERAPVAHARAMKDALEAAGRPVQWLYKPTEGHGFMAEDYRAELLRNVVEFARTHTAPPDA